MLVALLGGGLTLPVWLLASSRLAGAAVPIAIARVAVTCPDPFGMAT